MITDFGPNSNWNHRALPSRRRLALATGFWAFTKDFSYGAAAPYALALLLVATVPALLLGRWFERIAGAAS